MPWWRTDRNGYIAQVAVPTDRNLYPTTLVGVSPTGTIMIFYISGVFANGISFLLLRFITLVGVSPTGTIIIFCLRGVFANGISFLLLRFCETLLRHKFNCEELD